MGLEVAIQAARELTQALAEQKEQALKERAALSSLTAEKILQSAAQRAAFQTRLNGLMQKLAQVLENTKREIGLPEISLNALADARVEGGALFASALRDLRNAAAALRQLDQINHHLAERGLACVRAYGREFDVRSGSYNRTGAAATTPRSTVSRRA